MLAYLLSKITFLSFLFVQLSYFKSKHLLLVIATSVLLVTKYFTKDSYTLLEICSLLSALCIAQSREKFSLQICIYFISITIGCFFFAFYKNSWSFLIDLLNNQNGIQLEQKQIKEFFFSIAITLMLGGIPFVEWMMRIFSTLKPIVKITSLILPLFISLSVYEKLAADGLNFTLLGCLICLCSSLQIFFLKNIRIIFCNIITFFYGCTLIAISNHLPNYDTCFIIIAILVISVENFFTPKTTLKYRMKNFKDIFLSSKSDKILCSLSIICLLVIYFAFYANFLSKPYNMATMVSVASISCFFGKIVFFSSHKKLDTSHYNRNINTKETIKILALILLSSLSAIVIFTSNYQILHNSFTFNFIFQVLLFLLICLLFFLVFKSVSKLNMPTQINFSNIGKKIFAILSGVKISYDILLSILNDASFALKNENNVFSAKSFFSNLNNLFKNSVTLYYFAFILLFCIVLIIECVISR